MPDTDHFELWTDEPRRAGRPAPDGTVELALPEADAAAVRALASHGGASLGAVALAGFAAVLHRYTGRADIPIQIGPETGPEPGAETVQADLSGDPGFAELLGRLKLDQRQAAFTADGLSVTLDGFGDPDGAGTEPRVLAGHDRALYHEDTARRLAGHVATLLAGAAADPALPVSRLPLLTAAERETVDGWNATEVDYPTAHTVPELITLQARATPDAVAIRFEGTSVTYRELEERTNRLAHRLRALGVGPGSVVAVHLERSVELVVALVATLKAGGAYLPLDPQYPPARLMFMAGDAGARVLLTRRSLAARLNVPDLRPVCLDDPAEGLDDLPAEAQEGAPGLADLAYVIYTSGSTGMPKGVMNTHAGLLNRLLWMQEAYRLGPGDAVMQKTPCGFDVSVWEFFWPFIAGARLVVIKPDGHKDMEYLGEVVEAERVTFLHFVPPMLALFLEFADLSKCGSIRQVVCSGEALSADLARRFFASGLSAGLDNLYGPTEAAIDVTRWTCGPQDAITPIGAPIANTTVHVLDAHGNRMPVGMAGELHLGGVQLARGYLNRPELTAEKFVADPEDPDRRLYATGDLARWRADGVVEFLGRIDHQVKLNGSRIELGEIEAALLDHPGVAQAVVVLGEDNRGEPALVAYLVYRGDPEPGGRVRARLAERLPEYMLPTMYVALTEIPLSPNGKVDRGALPKPTVRDLGTSEAEFVAPRDDVERLLADLFGKVLGRGPISIKDSFFDLGGHSLLAARLTARLRRSFGIDVPMRMLYAGPTVESLAVALVEAALVAEKDK
ncbi:amino acid adenylation domain-containing protein [Sphaerisporangium sp. NPDC051017]|uniref:non-ribosomal peptide synthetase n=1 Tax=Sphaerisporangium sp. NPDC051017 TaxID=3154636 RepID=UPI0034343522